MGQLPRLRFIPIWYGDVSPDRVNPIYVIRGRMEVTGLEPVGPGSANRGVLRTCHPHFGAPRQDQQPRQGSLAPTSWRQAVFPWPGIACCRLVLALCSRLRRIATAHMRACTGFLHAVVHSLGADFHRVVENNRVSCKMTKDKSNKPQEDEEKYDPEVALERMNRALRGARVAGPKPLKEKPRSSRKKSLPRKG